MSLRNRGVERLANLLAILAVLGVGRAAHAACDTSICVGGSTCTISGTHTIDDLCTLDFGTSSVTVLKSARLTTATDGDSYSILAGALVVRGELEAHGGDISVDVDDDFTAETVSNSAGQVDVINGGSIDVTAGGAITIAGKDFTTKGSGGIDGGDIDLTAGGAVLIEKAVVASGGGVFAFGGYVTIEGASVTLTSTGKIESLGTQEGDGGEVDITATGACDLDDINTRGSGDSAYGGDIYVDCGSVTSGGRWDANGGSEGSGGDIDVFAETTLSTTSSANFTCTAGGGGDGCLATLSAGGDVSLSGDIDAGASGTDAFAGDIDLDSTDGDISIGSTATLTANTGTNGFFNGTITIGPACDIVIDGVVNTRTNVVGGGGNLVIYRESLDATSATMRADDDTGNTINCRCVDSDTNGVCDLPETCVSDPSLTGGTFNPTPVVDPTPQTGC